MKERALPLAVGGLTLGGLTVSGVAVSIAGTKPVTVQTEMDEKARYEPIDRPTPKPVDNPVPITIINTTDNKSNANNSNQNSVNLGHSILDDANAAKQMRTATEKPRRSTLQLNQVTLDHRTVDAPSPNDNGQLVFDVVFKNIQPGQYALTVNGKPGRPGNEALKSYETWPKDAPMDIREGYYDFIITTDSTGYYEGSLTMDLPVGKYETKLLLKQVGGDWPVIEALESFNFTIGSA